MMRRLALGLVLAVGPAAAEIVDIRQGTNLALAVDPAGEMLVVDLLGGLWRLPVTGGGATALIPAGSGIAQPRFDAAGERIVFQRWLDGQWDIWQLTLDDGQYVPLTESPFNEREPEFSRDGRRVVFASDRSGTYQLWELELARGGLRQLTDEAGASRFPSYSDAGELAYVYRIGERSSLRRSRDGPAGVALIESDRRLDSPSWRPGGGVIVYNTRVAGESSDLALFIEADEPVQRPLTRTEDVFVGRVAWLSPAEYLYAADGQLWRRRIGSTERAAVQMFAAASIEPLPPEPVSRRLDAAGPHAVAGINGLVSHPESGRQAFSALGDLWLVSGDELTRLTDDQAADAWPGFSADGQWLSFASDRSGRMQVWRLDLESGQMLQLTDGPGRAFLPRPSPDGRYVAYLETQGFGPWDRAALRIVAVDRPFRPETLADDLYDASDPIWQGSRIRLLARSENGREALARVFDTPAGEAEMQPQSVQERLQLPADALPSWQPIGADEPYVIQVDRLFDGVGDQYAYLMDIHISGQRITDIVRRGRLPLPARVIDARELTAVPGLIDVHAHQSTVGGAALGRAWLAHGITTVREVMADTGSALERAEAWASGQQAGPRLVIAPATPLAENELPASSPLLVSGGRIARGFSHGLAEQIARADDGLRPSDLPPVLASPAASTAPGLSVSTLGRSYQDVISQFSASGAWLPTGLAALAATAPNAGIGNLSGTVDRVMRSSGRIAIGSDSPAVPYGSGFHDELAILARQGIPEVQILRWATAGGALALGLSLETGTLERGRLADIVLVDGDPLENLAALGEIRAVIVGGVWHDAASFESTR